ncbi:PIR protein [Plasmodium ovale]|uniref:PIR Superfamily Protein n=2 Tax=Plasmodium ovale TaxID=36330 RepID=A0A1A8X723_PLAOA|nr:PIR Superfamily Protein [Plasmodium ovale curtisi]SBT84665.1 PIR protein [Plasmodium ovale]
MENEYEFFKYSESHFNNEKFAYVYPLEESYSNNCKFEHPGWEHYHTDICTNFKKIVSFLNKRKNAASLDANNKYEDYLNFWINFNLRKYENNKIEPSDFYKITNERDPSFFWTNFSIKISNIEPSIFENMKLLYNLYQEYHKIIDMTYKVHIDIGKCIEYANICLSMYNNIIKRCPSKDTETFCTALSDFEKSYNSIRTIKPFDSNNLPALPSYKDKTKLEKPVSDYSQQAVIQSQVTSVHTGSSPQHGVDFSSKYTIFVILASILGIFLILLSMYMFTPFGSWLLRRIQHKKITFSDLEEETNQLLNIDEDLLKYSDKVHYNISYNTVTNA